ncbi:hypothetical protein BDF22DRAFT_739509 [Syncephalis plumigaleata]|nr:hypothetical protein BDF22DRAFT_739509 [Syncephalis plumigaleata]
MPVHSRWKSLQVGPTHLVGLRVLWSDDTVEALEQSNANDIFDGDNGALFNQVLDVINPVIWQELDGLAMPRTASYWQQDDGQSGLYSGERFVLDYRWVEEPMHTTVYMVHNTRTTSSVDYRTRSLWPRTLWITLLPTSSKQALTKEDIRVYLEH